ANSLGEPGPSERQIEQILTAAARVPDHKKLVPWRFLLFQGDARNEVGTVLAGICQSEDKDAIQFRLQTESNHFLPEPLVLVVLPRRAVVVVSRVGRPAAAPEWGHVLSAGAG